nr:phage head closure protein [uncultured Gellertiella sp.]
MARFFLDAGALRHPLVLETPVGVADGQGGVSVSFAPLASLFARIEPLGPVETDDSGFADISRQIRVTIRARPDLRRGQRFASELRRFVIESVEDPDESGRYLVCTCREEPA